jgi:hypothetical protein
MSQHSNQVAQAAEKNPELLGTTNTGSREKQSPATASKVERSLVQGETLSPTDVVGNTSNRFDRAIDEEFVGDADTTAAKMEDKGREVLDTPNPENRFAPNNTGLERKAEGQKVGKVDGVEVNKLSGSLRTDEDGLGRPLGAVEGKVDGAQAEDNGDNVPEVQAAEDNTQRANEGRKEAEFRADNPAEVPGVAVYASPTVNEDGTQVEEELVNTTDKVETNSTDSREENLSNPSNTDADTAQSDAEKNASENTEGTENSTASDKDQAPTASPRER